MALTINHQTNDISATSGSVTIDGSNLTGGQTYDIQTFTASGTWTRPTGYLSTDEVWVWIVGGGGKGGRDSTSSEAVGANGGVGLFVPFDMSLLGSTETVTVGAGATSNAADGGNSEFGTWDSYGYVRGDGGESGTSNDGSTQPQYAVFYDEVQSATSSIQIASAENPFYGKAIKDRGGVYTGTTVYGGGAGGSNTGGGWSGGGFSMWGGNGGGAYANGGAAGAGGFPGGGGGANDQDFGDGGDGGDGIVVVYTKRTVL